MIIETCFIILTLSPAFHEEGTIAVNPANITSIAHGTRDNGHMYTSIRTSNYTEYVRVDQTMDAVLARIKAECSTKDDTPND